MIYDPYRKAQNEKPNLYSWKANRQFKWKSLIPAVAVYAGANWDTKTNPYTAPGIEGFSPKIAVISQNNFVGGWVFVINLIKDRIGTDYSELISEFHTAWIFMKIKKLTTVIPLRMSCDVKNEKFKRKKKLNQRKKANYKTT